MHKKLLNLDRLMLYIAMLSIVFLIATILAPHTGLPHEDAAILYTYTRNLSQYGIISYLPNGPRAEGATDFLWMVLLVPAGWLGIDIHGMSGILNFTAIIFACFRIFTLPNTTRKACAIASCVFTTAIFISGAFISGWAGFSSILFIALISICFLSFNYSTFDLLFIIASSLLLLLRPDGLVYFMSLSLGYAFEHSLYFTRNWQFTLPPTPPPHNRSKFRCFFVGLGSTIWNSRQVIINLSIPIAIFILYWIWRSCYFGMPFPLPFYVKQNFNISFLLYFKTALGLCNDPFIITGIVIVVFTFIAQYLLPMGICLSSPPLWRLQGVRAKLLSNWCRYMFKIADIDRSYLLFIFLCAGQVFYLARFNLLQNFALRFQAPAFAASISFVMVQLVLINPSAIKARNALSSTKNRLISLSFSFLVFGINGVIIAPSLLQYLDSKQSNNFYKISLGLSKLSSTAKPPSLLVTEAGILSYYTMLPTIDAWGLNTPAYSITPLSSVAEIIRLRPDIINVHANFAHMNFSPNYASQMSSNELRHRNWDIMSQAMISFGILYGYKIYVVPEIVHLSCCLSRTEAKSVLDVKRAQLSGKYENLNLFFVRPSTRFAVEIEKVLSRYHGFLVEEPADLRILTW